jgi:hypothetical protein
VSHPCPVRVCTWTVEDDDKLMCPKHWRMVPRWVQSAVYAAFDHRAGLGTPALHAAQSLAIRLVNDQTREAAP